MLKRITLLRDQVQNWNVYPFSVPSIRELREVNFRSRICFFAGENGSGKSTLLEAIAAHYGFGPEGGNRNFRHDTTESNHSIDPLVKALRLSFDIRTGKGFYLRAESFFNTATHRSLHTRSHGETFFTLLDFKFRRDGLFLLDEPEAALSSQRQLAFLILIHDVLRKCKDAQFIISTHSPVLLAYPKAQIFSFDADNVHEIDYEETGAFQVAHSFLNNRQQFLEELFAETPSLFEEDR